jgi:hypothetical protein
MDRHRGNVSILLRKPTNPFDWQILLIPIVEEDDFSNVLFCNALKNKWMTILHKERKHPKNIAPVDWVDEIILLQ